MSVALVLGLDTCTEVPFRELIHKFLSSSPPGETAEKVTTGFSRNLNGKFHELLPPAGMVIRVV